MVPPGVTGGTTPRLVVDGPTRIRRTAVLAPRPAGCQLGLGRAFGQVGGLAHAAAGRVERRPSHSPGSRPRPRRGLIVVLDRPGQRAMASSACRSGSPARPRAGVARLAHERRPSGRRSTGRSRGGDGRSTRRTTGPRSRAVVGDVRVVVRSSPRPAGSRRSSRRSRRRCRRRPARIASWTASKVRPDEPARAVDRLGVQRGELRPDSPCRPTRRLFLVRPPSRRRPSTGTWAP